MNEKKSDATVAEVVERICYSKDDGNDELEIHLRGGIMVVVNRSNSEYFTKRTEKAKGLQNLREIK